MHALGTVPQINPTCSSTLERLSTLIIWARSKMAEGIVLVVVVRGRLVASASRQGMLCALWEPLRVHISSLTPLRWLQSGSITDRDPPEKESMERGTESQSRSERKTRGRGRERGGVECDDRCTAAREERRPSQGCRNTAPSIHQRPPPLPNSSSAAMHGLQLARCPQDPTGKLIPWCREVRLGYYTV